MRHVWVAAVILLITFAPHLVLSRFIDARTFEELFAKADFVALAKPISATYDIRERSFLLGNVPVIGVVTEFQTLLVLKGTKKERFMLHHYREAPLPSGVAFVNGPTLLSFNPK